MNDVLVIAGSVALSLALCIVFEFMHGMWRAWRDDRGKGRHSR